MQHHFKKITLLLTCCVLTACGEGSVGEKLGIDRKPPDEFRVLSRPPLNVPPEFNLRPPSDGSEAAGLEAPTSEVAKQAVFGADAKGEASDTTALKEGTAPTAVMPVTSSDVASGNDQNFLNRAGVSVANPSIRQIIREESGMTGYEEEESVLKILGSENKREPMVDAEKEKERLKTNAQEGKPVDEGDTPTKLPKDRGILDKLDRIF
jgi:hypothetical protein